MEEPEDVTQRLDLEVLRPGTQHRAFTQGGRGRARTVQQAKNLCHKEKVWLYLWMTISRCSDWKSRSGDMITGPCGSVTPPSWARLSM